MMNRARRNPVTPVPDLPPQPTQAQWTIAGNCPACGSPIWYRTSDLTIDLSKPLVEQVPPMLYRHCTCPPQQTYQSGFRRPPLQKIMLQKAALPDADFDREGVVVQPNPNALYQRPLWLQKYMKEVEDQRSVKEGFPFNREGEFLR